MIQQQPINEDSHAWWVEFVNHITYLLSMIQIFIAHDIKMYTHLYKRPPTIMTLLAPQYYYILLIWSCDNHVCGFHHELL